MKFWIFKFHFFYGHCCRALICFDQKINILEQKEVNSHEFSFRIFFCFSEIQFLTLQGGKFLHIRPAYDVIFA